MFHKTKRRFFGKIDHRVVSDNRKFWKTVGHLFSEKAFYKESIILHNIKKTSSNNEVLAETFNKHFSKPVESLDTDKTLASNIRAHSFVAHSFQELFFVNQAKTIDGTLPTTMAEDSLSYGKEEYISFSVTSENTKHLDHILRNYFILALISFCVNIFSKNKGLRFTKLFLKFL